MGSALVIGVDAGGTKTALRAEAGGRALHLVGPGLNLRRDGQEAAARRLTALVAEAVAAHPGHPLDGLAVGLAGGGDEDDRAALGQRLRSALALGPAFPLLVVHDAEIALEAAFGDGPGVVVIAGTGSVVYARLYTGDTLRAGGWGSRLGDAGSGTALGRAALRAACAHHDGGLPTTLTARLAEAYGLDDLDALLGWASDESNDPATLAPLLVAAADGGDGVAGDLLEAETDALAQQAAWLVRRAGGRAERRIALLGGLLNETPYQQALLQALAHRLPGWFASVADRAPVEGAVALARKLGHDQAGARA